MGHHETDQDILYKGSERGRSGQRAYSKKKWVKIFLIWGKKQTSRSREFQIKGIQRDHTETYDN